MVERVVQNNVNLYPQTGTTYTGLRISCLLFLFEWELCFYIYRELWRLGCPSVSYSLVCRIVACRLCLVLSDSILSAGTEAGWHYVFFVRVDTARPAQQQTRITYVGKTKYLLEKIRLGTHNIKTLSEKSGPRTHQTH